MKQLREADILRACLTWLRLHGVYCWRQNQGASRGEYKGSAASCALPACRGSATS